jgi:hypothetical protein
LSKQVSNYSPLWILCKQLEPEAAPTSMTSPSCDVPQNHLFHSRTETLYCPQRKSRKFWNAIAVPSKTAVFILKYLTPNSGHIAHCCRNTRCVYWCWSKRWWWRCSCPVMLKQQAVWGGARCLVNDGRISLTKVICNWAKNKRLIVYLNRKDFLELQEKSYFITSDCAVIARFPRKVGKIPTSNQTWFPGILLQWDNIPISYCSCRKTFIAYCSCRNNSCILRQL